MKEYTTIRCGGIPLIDWKQPIGSIIDVEDDVEKCFHYLILEPRVVPDPDHQSSLDYLKGV